MAEGRASSVKVARTKNHLLLVVFKTIAHSGLKYVSPFFKRNLLLQNLFMSFGIYCSVWNKSQSVCRGSVVGRLGVACIRRHSTGSSVVLIFVVGDSKGS